MVETEKFSIVKFFQGFVNPVTNAKNVQFLLWLIAIIFVAITIWRAFFMSTQAQKQTTGILALPGSHITYAPQQSQKQEKKHPWWLPAPFIEGYGFAESDGRTGIGAKGGLRLEF